MHTELTRELADCLFRGRKEAMAGMPQINNSDLVAGSLMYFYCDFCGSISEILPEDYTDRPTHVCGPCKEMLERKWLSEDQRAIRR